MSVAMPYWISASHKNPMSHVNVWTWQRYTLSESPLVFSIQLSVIMAAGRTNMATDTRDVGGIDGCEPQKHMDRLVNEFNSDRPNDSNLLIGGVFKYLLFSPRFGEDEPILTSIFFRWVGSSTNQQCFLQEILESGHPRT